jgi:NAD(P)-dependent dehydrogenase (short-subunit alcohol dehydrogenase family)
LDTKTVEKATRTRTGERHVALVTGSSRGSAIAQRLAHDGLAVAVNDIHGGARALDVVAGIRDDGGVATPSPAM